MRCPKCNRNIGLIRKSCPKCGTAVTSEQRKKGLITFGIWVFLFVLLTPTIYFLLEKYDPYIQDVQKYSHLKIFLTSAFFSLVVVEIIALIYWIFSSIVRFFIRQTILASIIFGALIILVGFAGYIYLTEKNEQKFSDSLALIQDNLTEVMVAKIMGDSLLEKKKLITASWERVDIETQMVLGRLKELEVPEELGSYQIDAIIWTEKIVAGVKNHKLWDTVGDDPGAFQLALSHSQAQKLFAGANKKIAELKEFGDTAIEEKNNVSMLYIGAKMAVQRHWLSGIMHSEKRGLLSYNLAPTAFAVVEGVPPVGHGVDVTCQVCNDSSVHWTAQLRQQYGCDTKCKGSVQQNQQQDQGIKKDPITDTYQFQKPNVNQQTNNQQNNNGNAVNNNAGNGQAGGDYQTPKRKICIGRGGISTGNSATNVYCVEDVIQSTNGIDASAINIAEGNAVGKNGWNDGWHQLEGLGVISIGESAESASGHTPTVQKFYDDCTAHGGTVSNAGMAKSRLPTTEFGYTCGFENSDGKECWAYLTYSGGQYMGGNPGCPEQNLLPNTAEEQAKAGKSGKWDGHYIGMLNMNCRFTLPDRPYASQSFQMDFSVVNNVTYDSTVGAYVIIDNNGNAIESFQTTMGGEGFTVSIYALFNFHFVKQGNNTVFSTSGSMDATGYREDGIYYGSCVGTGSGAAK
jgi:hypothetical protein